MAFNCAFRRDLLPPGRGAAWLRSEVGPRLVAMVRRLREVAPGSPGTRAR
jgi:hypothetical protein